LTHLAKLHPSPAGNEAAAAARDVAAIVCLVAAAGHTVSHLRLRLAEDAHAPLADATVVDAVGHAEIAQFHSLHIDTDDHAQHSHGVAAQEVASVDNGDIHAVHPEDVACELDEEGYCPSTRCSQMLVEHSQRRSCEEANGHRGLIHLHDAFEKSHASMTASRLRPAHEHGCVYMLCSRIEEAHGSHH